MIKKIKINIWEYLFYNVIESISLGEVHYFKITYEYRIYIIYGCCLHELIVTTLFTTIIVLISSYLLNSSEVDRTSGKWQYGENYTLDTLDSKLFFFDKVSKLMDAVFFLLWTSKTIYNLKIMNNVSALMNHFYMAN